MASPYTNPVRDPILMNDEERRRLEEEQRLTPAAPRAAATPVAEPAVEAPGVVNRLEATFGDRTDTIIGSPTSPEEAQKAADAYRAGGGGNAQAPGAQGQEGPARGLTGPPVETAEEVAVRVADVDNELRVKAAKKAASPERTARAQAITGGVEAGWDKVNREIASKAVNNEVLSANEVRSLRKAVASTTPKSMTTKTFLGKMGDVLLEVDKQKRAAGVALIKAADATQVSTREEWEKLVRETITPEEFPLAAELAREEYMAAPERIEKLALHADKLKVTREQQLENRRSDDADAFAKRRIGEGLSTEDADDLKKRIEGGTATEEEEAAFQVFRAEDADPASSIKRNEKAAQQKNAAANTLDLSSKLDQKLLLEETLLNQQQLDAINLKIPEYSGPSAESRLDISRDNPTAVTGRIARAVAGGMALEAATREEIGRLIDTGSLAKFPSTVEFNVNRFMALAQAEVLEDAKRAGKELSDGIAATQEAFRGEAANTSVSIVKGEQDDAVMQRVRIAVPEGGDITDVNPRDVAAQFAEDILMSSPRSDNETLAFDMAHDLWTGAGEGAPPLTELERRALAPIFDVFDAAMFRVSEAIGVERGALAKETEKARRTVERVTAEAGASGQVAIFSPDSSDHRTVSQATYDRFDGKIASYVDGDGKLVLYDGGNPDVKRWSDALGSLRASKDVRANELSSVVKSLDGVMYMEGEPRYETYGEPWVAMNVIGNEDMQNKARHMYGLLFDGENGAMTAAFNDPSPRKWIAAFGGEGPQAEVFATELEKIIAKIDTTAAARTSETGTTPLSAEDIVKNLKVDDAGANGRYQKLVANVLTDRIQQSGLVRDLILSTDGDLRRAGINIAMVGYIKGAEGRIGISAEKYSEEVMREIGDGGWDRADPEEAALISNAMYEAHERHVRDIDDEMDAMGLVGVSDKIIKEKMSKGVDLEGWAEIADRSVVGVAEAKELEAIRAMPLQTINPSQNPRHVLTKYPRVYVGDVLREMTSDVGWGFLERRTTVVNDALSLTDDEWEKRYKSKLDSRAERAMKGDWFKDDWDKLYDKAWEEATRRATKEAVKLHRERVRDQRLKDAPSEGLRRAMEED